MLKRLLIRFGLWLARLGGWNPTNDLDIRTVFGITPEIYESAALMAAQAEEIKNVSGEYKRREVLRALLNRHPGAKESDLNLAIEMVLKWTS